MVPLSISPKLFKAFFTVSVESYCFDERNRFPTIFRKFGLVLHSFWIFEKIPVVPFAKPRVRSPLHLTKKNFKHVFIDWLKVIILMRGNGFDNFQRVWTSWGGFWIFLKISCGPPLLSLGYPYLWSLCIWQKKILNMFLLIDWK
jgi:hypothetical protein